MSERSLTVKTLMSKSLLVFLKNRPTFLLIFTFLILPLSILHFTLSLTSLPTRRHILRLESLARLSHTLFEARQVFQESRSDALSLLRLKLLLLLPSLSLSLLSAVASVVSAASNPSPKKLLFSKPIWVNSLLTSLFVYIITFVYSSGVNVLMAGLSRSGLGLLVWVIGLGLEIYLMGVMGLGLVSSILENRVGLEAVRVGWEIMEWNKVCGWLVSGVLMMLTWLIGWELERLVEMRGQDDYGNVKRTVGMRGWEIFGLVVVYGIVVVFGFVVFTVFYCESRKRVVRGGDGGEEETEEESLGVIL